MNLFKENIRAEIIKEVKFRLFEESVPRIKKCLDQLNEQEIWKRHSDQTVSVGNLVLHLCGNVRQYILTGLGNRDDTRNRQVEFDEKGPIPTDKLIGDLDDLMNEVGEVLDDMDPEELLKVRKVQGFESSGLGILVHVVEHFSYHVGQITYIVKSTKNVDLKYYGEVDLNKTGSQ